MQFKAIVEQDGYKGVLLDADGIMTLRQEMKTTAVFQNEDNRHGALALVNFLEELYLQGKKNA